MKTTLLSLLLLTRVAAAEPQFFRAVGDKQGNILLVAEDGVKEAEAIARAGYDCALSHASELKQIEADEFWTRKKVGWEAHQDEPGSVTASNLVTVVGLNRKAPLVWTLHKGVVCIDPHPELGVYKAEKPLVLVAAETDDKICQQLGPIAFFDDKERRVSAHYVVDREGTTIQMVDERRAAWHAGVPYPEAQYQAVAGIIKDLRKRWEVPDNHIVSHAAIARPVGRKSDPVGFDFDKLKKMLDSSNP